MKKITAAAKKSAPKFVNDTDVQVTREFAKWEITVRLQLAFG